MELPIRPLLFRPRTSIGWRTRWGGRKSVALANLWDLKKVEGLIYAVGDVHGCYQLLRRAIEEVHRHARGRAFRIVCLGDYIDRGEKVRETVELLMEMHSGGQVVCLKGNHEEMFQRCIDGRRARDLDFWTAHGGDATLRSYGCGRAVRDMADNLPPGHMAWLTNRPSVYKTRHHLFVHAGLAADRSLEEQAPHDLLWIRDRFLKRRPDEFVERRHIVHGHTPEWKGKPDAALPEFLSHRTNLDTGAFDTGVLSVGVFNANVAGGPIDLLSAV